jgi:hypothetical protein
MTPDPTWNFQNPECKHRLLDIFRRESDAMFEPHQRRVTPDRVSGSYRNSVRRVPELDTSWREAGYPSRVARNSRCATERWHRDARVRPTVAVAKFAGTTTRHTSLPLKPAHRIPRGVRVRVSRGTDPVDMQTCMCHFVLTHRFRFGLREPERLTHPPAGSRSSSDLRHEEQHDQHKMASMPVYTSSLVESVHAIAANARRVLWPRNVPGFAAGHLSSVALEPDAVVCDHDHVYGRNLSVPTPRPYQSMRGAASIRTALGAIACRMSDTISASQWRQ